MFTLKSKDLAILLEEINQDAKFSLSFLLLTIFSCLIATFGLHLNNSSVIIGAMIIAPLMQPILAISIELITADLDNARNAVISLAIGVITGILISFLLSLIINSPEATNEIISRTKPNLLDLGVAVFAGATAAYIRSQEKLSQSIAGVAIAVALMPPLCVIGYEMAHADLLGTTGATLLFITNLNGILLASSVTFLFLGYYRFTRTFKWLISTAVITLIIIFPLSISLMDIFKESKLRKEIKTILKRETKTFSKVELIDVKVSKMAKTYNVRATVRTSNSNITCTQANLVKDLLKQKTNENIDFAIEVIPTLTIMCEE